MLVPPAPAPAAATLAHRQQLRLQPSPGPLLLAARQRRTRTWPSQSTPGRPLLSCPTHSARGGAGIRAAENCSSPRPACPTLRKRLLLHLLLAQRQPRRHQRRSCWRPASPSPMRGCRSSAYSTTSGSGSSLQSRRSLQQAGSASPSRSGSTAFPWRSASCRCRTPLPSLPAHRAHRSCLSCLRQLRQQPLCLQHPQRRQRQQHQCLRQQSLQRLQRRHHPRTHRQQPCTSLLPPAARPVQPSLGGLPLRQPCLQGKRP